MWYRFICLWLGLLYGGQLAAQVSARQVFDKIHVSTQLLDEQTPDSSANIDVLSCVISDIDLFTRLYRTGNTSNSWLKKLEFSAAQLLRKLTGYRSLKAEERNETDATRYGTAIADFKLLVQDARAQLFPSTDDSVLVLLHKVQSRVEELNGSLVAVHDQLTAARDSIGTLQRRLQELAPVVHQIDSELRDPDSSFFGLATVGLYEGLVVAPGLTMIWPHKQDRAHPLAFSGGLLLPTRSAIHPHAGGFLAAGFQHRKTIFQAGAAIIRNERSNADAGWLTQVLYLPARRLGLGVSYTPVIGVGATLVYKFLR